MSEWRQCKECGGLGRIEIGVGLTALQDKYPDLPIREIARRGWFGDVGDGEDVELCDANFLKFWKVSSHEELQEQFRRKRVVGYAEARR